MRKEYELTDDQLSRLYDASKPVPLIALQCGMPASPQEVANAVWKALTDMSSNPSSSPRRSPKGDKFFTAEQKE